MTFESEHDLGTLDGAAPEGSLPVDVVLTDRAIARLRAYLNANAMASYRIFHNADLDLDDIDRHLPALKEHATWELAALAEGAEQLSTLARNDGGILRCGGVLHLRSHQVVLGRWSWFSTSEGVVQWFWLCAADSIDDFARLQQKVRRLRRAHGASVWQVVSGAPYRDGPRSSRPALRPDDLILSDGLRRRIEIDVVGFFDPRVVAMYRTMAVPCRRGVLLHGPPGNGKTSIIRLVGSMLPEIPVLLLRPHGNFSSEDLSQVIRRWTRQAPAILVIEDLNWLLKSIDISMFLNVLDGIDSPDASGLLLIATTNYPEQLDPAINNRPGRFDVVIEVASPDAATREQFFRTKLPGFSEATIAGLVSSSDRFAFAHLQEVLRLSGLLAIYESRAQRSDNHLFQAAKMVQNSFEDATRGFPGRPEVPFGLEYLRKLPRRGE